MRRTVAFANWGEKERYLVVEIAAFGQLEALVEHIGYNYMKDHWQDLQEPFHLPKNWVLC